VLPILVGGAFGLRDRGSVVRVGSGLIGCGKRSGLFGGSLSDHLALSFTSLA
jgi:hypothetical protein